MKLFYIYKWSTLQSSLGPLSWSVITAFTHFYIATMNHIHLIGNIIKQNGNEIIHSAIIAADISMTWADSNIKVHQLLIQAGNLIPQKLLHYSFLIYIYTYTDLMHIEMCRNTGLTPLQMDIASLDMDLG